MGKLFGTDGIRGIAGQTLTAELAFHVGQAVAAVLTEEKGSRPLITIGKDTRISSDMLEAALMAGICSVGGDVMPLGTIPTPAVAFLTVQQQADAGIVISASHNPYAYNGIKVFNAQGYKLSDEMEGRVEDLILNHAELPAAVDGAVGRRHHGMHALHSAYVQHLLGSIDCDLTGLRVLVDCANGAASATAPDLFRALPLQADFIHTEPDGVNINNGCGSTHLESLARGVVSGGYDLGIAFDGDADRCLLVDEQGNTIDGDKVMAVCASELKRQGKLSGNTVVATVMSNLGLHEYCRENGLPYVEVSAATGQNTDRLKAEIIRLAPAEFREDPLLAGDLIKPGDTVVLVVPIDLSAPKGRLILPQVQVLREILDGNAVAVVAKEHDLKAALANLKEPPALVITDSQVVMKVAPEVPPEIKMTTFSALFARYKGDIGVFLRGAKKIDELNDGDRILIAEACSHHVQCDDIGRVKIPAWLRQYTGRKLEFEFCSGGDFPEDLEKYALVVHCGACMLNRAEMIRRLKECERRGVAVTNYGIAISKTRGLLERISAPLTA